MPKIEWSKTHWWKKEFHAQINNEQHRQRPTFWNCPQPASQPPPLTPCDWLWLLPQRWPSDSQWIIDLHLPRPNVFYFLNIFLEAPLCLHYTQSVSNRCRTPRWVYALCRDDLRLISRLQSTRTDYYIERTPAPAAAWWTINEQAAEK